MKTKSNSLQKNPCAQVKNRKRKQIYLRNLMKVKQNAQKKKNQQKKDPKKIPQNFLSLMNQYSKNESKQQDKQKKIRVQQKQPETFIHGYYSYYIPLAHNLFHSDELHFTFPYFQFIGTKNLQISKKIYTQELTNFIIDLKKSQKIPMPAIWQKCLETFMCGIDTFDKLSIYTQLQKKGTSQYRQLFEHFKRQTKSNCKQQIFISAVKGISKYFTKSKDSKVLKKMSVFKKQEVNKTTISNTMKMLFCPICLIYDCGRHVDQSKDYQHSHQYVCFQGPVGKKEQIISIQRIHKKQLQISYNASYEQNQQQKCSQKCYHYLTSQSYSKLQQQYNKLCSPYVKSFIEIGIHMFKYNPCKIWFLLKGDITCETVFMYIKEDIKIAEKLKNNFKSNEENFLKNLTKYSISNHQHSFQESIRERRDTIFYKSHQISICRHHFLDHQTFDINCENCVCTKRGYCCRECLCSSTCPLKKGCDCKKGACNMNKCNCFKNSKQCQPGICRNCFDFEDQEEKFTKGNDCKNNQIQNKKWKNIKIAISNIPSAGLGAFAFSNIKANELVTTYKGQMIDFDVDSLRQSFSKNLSFFNFAIEGGSVDSRYKGNKARFINHGNEGQDNLTSEVKYVNGTHVIAFYARKDIQQDQEMLFNYDGNGDLVKYHKEKYPFIKQTKKKLK